MNQTGKFTRTSAASFLDPNDLCLIQVTIINMKKLSGIYIADSMTKCSVISILINKCECPDSLCIISHPYTQLILALDIFYRTQRQRNLFSFSYYLQLHSILFQLFKIFYKIFFSFNNFIIKCNDIISRLYNFFCRFLRTAFFRNNLTGINYQYSVGFHIDSDSASTDKHCRTVCGDYFDIFKRYHSQNSAG